MKWQQFFQDDAGVFSSTRVVYILCFIVSSAIMWVLVGTGKMTESYLVNYMAIFALGFVGGKLSDATTKWSKGNARNTNRR